MASAADAEPPRARGTETYAWLQSYPRNVDWHANFEARPLYRLMDDAAAAFGASACTNFLGRVHTYAEIADLVNQTAAGLQKLGLEKGARVGLMLPNSPTFIIYYFGVLKAGGIVVNFNPLYTVEELARQVEDSGTELMVTLDLKLLCGKVEALIEAGKLPRAIVASFAGLLPGAKSVLFRLFKGRELTRIGNSPVKASLIAEEDVRTAGNRPEPVTIDPVNDIAVLQYTGGTTGVPKGAMLTHANVYINVHQAVAWVPDLVPGKERILGALPFFHVFAMTGVMNFGIATGAEIVIMPRFVLAEAMTLITKTRPTVMPGVPT
ncbi:MAG: AMP-binding protein, partial [Proteobacteria bacterium]|nr:AMP-binding protein [Pseudomonadota bacterium]